MGNRAFSIAAPFLWNSLPMPIRQETSIDSFKNENVTVQSKLVVNHSKKYLNLLKKARKSMLILINGPMMKLTYC